ncbi:Rha family transcriptional regulator [Leptospira sp. GIMC2001]|uniref:Rha family transcriptional regulator n=1 Tax=Leptospira sp. GIMC2001 TaxID=1513297 RepID=UPI00234A4C82|nr:Rha family transcriptional regulator [Leptospira sp. GIMC2001]WCL51499.1 Rha family transcriptional regulator [Leptospira sp. GIMC2001]
MKLEKIDQTKTMSSFEIAELTNKRHDNVMTDVRTMLEKLSLHAPDFSGTQKYGNNNTREVFNLPYRETMILVSGYSVELRAKVVDRWIELERQVKRSKKQLSPERVESIRTRNSFTKTLEEHGCNKPAHFINITYIQKDGLNIPRKKKKAEYSNTELLLTTATEALSTFHLIAQDVHGYHNIKPIASHVADVVYDGSYGIIEERKKLIGKLESTSLMVSKND